MPAASTPGRCRAGTSLPTATGARRISPRLAAPPTAAAAARPVAQALARCEPPLRTYRTLRQARASHPGRGQGRRPALQPSRDACDGGARSASAAHEDSASAAHEDSAPASTSSSSSLSLLAALASTAATSLLTALPAAAAGGGGLSYDPASGSDFLKNVAGVAYVVLLVIFAGRLLTRRASTATSTRLASAAPAPPSRRREVARATPGRAAWAALQAGACAAALYAVCLGVDAFFEGRALPDAYSARNIAVTLRTIGRGLAYLLTFIFGANAVGLTGRVMTGGRSGRDGQAQARYARPRFSPRRRPPPPPKPHLALTTPSPQHTITTGLAIQLVFYPEPEDLYAVPAGGDKGSTAGVSADASPGGEAAGAAAGAGEAGHLPPPATPS